MARWPAATSSDAVSIGSIRPTGLNGSRQLSPPAASSTPACSSSADRRQPPRHQGRLPPALQTQVGLRQRHQRHPGGGQGAGQRPGLVGGLLAEADTVRGGGPAAEAELLDPPQVPDERQPAGVCGLIQVQVDGQAGVGRGGGELVY